MVVSTNSGGQLGDWKIPKLSKSATLRNTRKGNQTPSLTAKDLEEETQEKTQGW